MLSRALLALTLVACAMGAPGIAVPAMAQTGPKSAVTLKLSDVSLEPGQALVAKGKLAAPTKRRVYLQSRVGSTWRTVAKSTSNRRGGYSIRTKAPTVEGRVLFRTVAPTVRTRTGRLPAVSSKKVAARVAARASSVTAVVARTSYAVGETVEVTGNVLPAQARPLELQRLEADGAWRTVGAASSTPAGAGTLTHLLAAAGTWTYRVIAPASAGSAPAVSAPVSVSATAPAPATTRIQVVVTGLPTGQAADILLSAPGQPDRVVTGDVLIDHVSAGSWTVTTRPVIVGTDAYHGVEDVRALNVAQGSTTSIVVDYGVIVPETTVVSPPSEIAAVTDLGDGTLRISLAPGAPTASPAEVAARHRRQVARLVRTGMDRTEASSESTCRAMENGILCEGNIFVADRSPQSPNGVFARVPDGGLIDNNTFLVTTRGATLTEAVKLGRTPAADLGKELEVSKHVETKTFTCSGNLKVAIDASAEVAPTLDFSLEVAWGRLTKAEAIATIEQTAALTATATGEGTCETAPQTLIDRRPLPPVTVHVGPIPVVLSPRLHVSLKAEGRAAGSAKLGWTERSAARFGLTYDGENFKAVKEVEPPTMTDVPAQLQGDVNARATLTAGIDVLLYGVAGPRIAADAALTANAAAYGTASAASVNWSVGYEVSAHAQFVSNEALDKGALGVESEKLVIWGPHSNTLLSGMNAWNPPADYFPRITTTSLPPAEVGTAYSELVSTADNRAGWWQLEGTLPDGLTIDRDTGRIGGVPTRVESTSFSVRFTDGHGRTVTSGLLTVKVGEREAGILPDAFIGSGTTPPDYYERLPEAVGSAGEWSIESGGLPPGLAFTSDGWVTGRPTGGSRHTFVARLDSPDGTVFRKEYQLAVVEAWMTSSCTYQPGKTMIVAGLDLSLYALNAHHVVVRMNGVTQIDAMTEPGKMNAGIFRDDLQSGVPYAVDLVVDGYEYHMDVFCPSP